MKHDFARQASGHAITIRLVLLSGLLLISLLLTGGSAMSTTNKTTNRLINETSPYLLQHANNPVDWYPWGPEALAKAKAEGKLILVSIGYAACHWCHVMERESFESESTAAILNKYFVAIKVDREERPDLDGHFMDILTSMTGSGGWPLNMFLTPDLKPVYGGSYFPPTARYNRPSFEDVLLSLQEQWSGSREEMLKDLEKLQSYLTAKLAVAKGGPASSSAKDPREQSVTYWHDRFDWEHGGFGVSNKFPQPPILSMILRQAALLSDLTIAEPVLLTLDKMAAGGIRDQLGGAFHRYSVDRYWQVPHFEIMLYDNALLARVYLEAFQLTGHSRYKFITRQILDAMLATFRVDGGCFVSAMDADSDGEEGLYYTWSEEEVAAVLAPEAAEDFLADFVDPLEGTVEGRSVLRLLSANSEIEQTIGKHADNIKKLITARQQRIPPAKDDKILTSWNAMMVSALAKAGAVLAEPGYLKAAEACMADLLDRSFVAGQPRHSRRDSKVGNVVFLDDYAALIQAGLDLYEASFDLSYLETADSLAQQMLLRFWIDKEIPLPLTPNDHPADIPQRVELADGVTPAGHSQALVALHRLALFSIGDRFEDEAAHMMNNLGGYLEQNSHSSPELLGVLDFNSATAKEVIIVGPMAAVATQDMLAVVHNKLRPGMILAVVDPATAVDSEKFPLLNRVMVDERPTAYVCRNLVCRLPVFTPDDLEKMLEER